MQIVAERETPVLVFGPHKDVEGLRAAKALFGRLENKLHNAGPIRIVAQQRHRPQQGCGMAVMPAGMHDAWIGGSVWQAGGLGDRQRIHIRAQAH